MRKTALFVSLTLTALLTSFATHAQSIVLNGYSSAGFMNYFPTHSTGNKLLPCVNAGLEAGYFPGNSGFGFTGSIGYGYYQAAANIDARSVTFGDLVASKDRMQTLDMGFDGWYRLTKKKNLMESPKHHISVAPIFGIGMHKSLMIGYQNHYQYADADYFDGNRTGSDVIERDYTNAKLQLMTVRATVGAQISCSSGFMVTPYISYRFGGIMNSCFNWSEFYKGPLTGVFMGGVKIGFEFKKSMCSRRINPPIE